MPDHVNEMRFECRKDNAGPSGILSYSRFLQCLRQYVIINEVIHIRLLQLLRIEIGVANSGIYTEGKQHQWRQNNEDDRQRYSSRPTKPDHTLLCSPTVMR